MTVTVVVSIRSPIRHLIAGILRLVGSIGCFVAVTLLTGRGLKAFPGVPHRALLTLKQGDENGFRSMLIVAGLLLSGPERHGFGVAVGEPIHVGIAVFAHPDASGNIRPRFADHIAVLPNVPGRFLHLELR